MNLEQLFSIKLTENGDLCFDRCSSTNNLLNIFFMSEYYNKHLNEVHIGNSFEEQLFSMFIRDPRFGVGKRDLGRVLMKQSKLSLQNIVKAGRFDDLLYTHKDNLEMVSDFWKEEINKNNELAKKWAPRYSSKNLNAARFFAHLWGLNKQDYGKFIKVDTTESNLSRKTTENIVFEHIPSLALIKYWKRFENGEDTKERFAKYQEDVKSGKKELHVSTTNVYDIYRNRGKIDPDLVFNKMEKISLNCIPIVDTSGSMLIDDAMGKALAIGHALAKGSTYAPNKVITFSSRPTLIDLGKERKNSITYEKDSFSFIPYVPKFTPTGKSQYMDEICSMITNDCSNTNLSAVMDILCELDSFPEYIVVLSDMEFDEGGNRSTDRLKQIMQEHGANTKLIWWNLNSRNMTSPRMDEDGNIFMSGYSPQLLKYMQIGFNADQFLSELLKEYARKII